MASFPSTAKEPVGHAADGSTYKVGDPVLIVGEVIDISDALLEVTIVTVRVPERLGGVGFMSFEDRKIVGVAKTAP